ncbi:MAG: hypothetical protein NTZ05_20680 [Chloroflexi bacterium]|nr:hypothetical protein [Chloroflexota bacterium]
MGQLHVFSARSGHDTVTWDTDTDAADAVREAERIFKERTAEGRLAFRFAKGATDGEQIREFDPNAHEIYIIAPMVGG